MAVSQLRWADKRSSSEDADLYRRSASDLGIDYLSAAPSLINQQAVLAIML
jgi:hypothetical protein